MRKIVQISIVALMFLLTGCYPGIRGKVVDAVTGNPLEGAVVLAQWTTTWGFGLTYHKLYKIVETETDKEGSFSLSGVYNPFVDQPSMVIYKKGYVPFRNDMISFENRRRKSKVIWEDNGVYSLSNWENKYSQLTLDVFVGSGIIGSDFNVTPKFSTIQAELSRASQKEVDQKKKSLMKREANQ